MHDPLTVAFEIKYPWRAGRIGIKTNHPYRKSFITIWHKDPEKDGTDDSCGWFMRSRHGSVSVLNKIKKSFEQNWDRVFTSDESGKTYFCGYFNPVSGDPVMSVYAIVLNLIFLAAREVLGGSDYGRVRARRFCTKHLVEILLFAENPVDSLHDSIILKFGKSENREKRISSMASCIYAWILREQRPWWKHPKWHVWHWRIQVHPLQKLWRFLFRRCCKCGKRLGWNESPISSWSGNSIWHQGCDDSRVKE